MEVFEEAMRSTSLVSNQVIKGRLNVRPTVLTRVRPARSDQWFRHLRAVPIGPACKFV
jgi:hypothetical protein